MHKALSMSAVAAALALSIAPLFARADAAEHPWIGVVDMHDDLPWQVHFKGRSDDLKEGMLSLQAMQQGHYVGLVLPIYLPDKAHKDGPHIADADAVFETIRRIVAKHPQAFGPMLAPYGPGERISTFLAIEGGGAFAEDITAIDRFIARGLRFVSPCHQADTKLASSATGKSKGAYGLTDLGKQFANRVYDGGALIDVSHVSDATFADLVPIAKAHGAPIVATHSNARAIANVSRNLTDDELRTIAESGGIAGINFHSQFVNGEKTATMDDLLKMIDHMVAVAGIDHIGLGSDFDGGIDPVEGLEDASKLPALQAALEKHGMKHDDVMKIFGLNALRVIGWRPTAATKNSAQ